MVTGVRPEPFGDNGLEILLLWCSQWKATSYLNSGASGIVSHPEYPVPLSQIVRSAGTATIWYTVLHHRRNEGPPWSIVLPKISCMVATSILPL